MLGFGSGFMIGDGVLITNNHVLGNSETARASEAEAHYEYGLYGDEERVERFALLPDTLFYTSPELDFTIVAVAPAALGSGAKLAALGWLPRSPNRKEMEASGHPHPAPEWRAQTALRGGIVDK